MTILIEYTYIQTVLFMMILKQEIQTFVYCQKHKMI